jgi:hypothetical protein
MRLEGYREYFWFVVVLFVLLTCVAIQKTEHSRIADQAITEPEVGGTEH